jgi:large subunit ribosomal protein L15
VSTEIAKFFPNVKCFTMKWVSSGVGERGILWSPYSKESEEADDSKEKRNSSASSESSESSVSFQKSLYHHPICHYDLHPICRFPSFSAARSTLCMLHTIKPAHGATHKRKRVARGNSAGGGTTAGRGTKGQDARSGKGKRVRAFEGGQTPLTRRQPKLGGFSKPRRVNYEVVNLETLEARLDAGSYDVVALRKARIVRTGMPVKILSSGTVTKKFAITAHAASKSAKEALKKAGGSFTVSK